ncbi:MAG: KH domain-containing protein [Candidatus Hodarchaeota archaeon]
MKVAFCNDGLTFCQHFEQITGLIPFGCEIIENKIKKRIVFLFKPDTETELLETTRRQLVRNWNYSYPFEVVILHKQVEDFLRTFLSPILVLDLNTINNGKKIIITLKVPYEDRGKVIGKKGNRIKCLRQLLSQYYKINNLKLLF